MNRMISRREIFRIMPGTALAMTPLRRLLAQPGRGTHVLLGSSGTVSKGIYQADWDSKTGALGPITLAAELPSPTFLAVHRAGSRTLVYCVREVDGPRAGVTAFAYNPAGTKPLRFINAQSTEGDGPTHLSVSPDGDMLAAANYSGGSVTSFHLSADGSISAPVTHLQYAGHGADAERQKAPHAHSAQFSPDGHWLLVNDLGLDRINVYRADNATGALTPAAAPYWSSRPGTGPRHIAFHPNGRWVYSVNELDSTVDILAWDTVQGTLTAHGHVSTLPEGFPAGKAFAGEILISADGRNLYVGNRIAAETIAVFTVGDGGQRLTLTGAASNGGKLTRHIALDPTGRWMLVSNQGSGTLVVLRRDTKTGALSEPVHTYPLHTVMFAVVI